MTQRSSLPFLEPGDAADVIWIMRPVETARELRRDGLHWDAPSSAMAAVMEVINGGVCGRSVSSIETSGMNLPLPWPQWR